MLKAYYPGLVALWVMACAPQSTTIPVHDREQLVWQDDFERLDTTRWTIYVGDGCPENCGFGNNELQYYTDRLANLRISDGVLRLIAAKDSMGSKAYTSAKLMTRGKGDWQYGRVEVRARLPVGRGTWPAIWLLPTLDRPMQWPRDGEIDLMEHVGYNAGTVYGTVHTQKYNHVIGTQKSDSVQVAEIGEKFHIYSLDWTPDHLNWAVDGKSYFFLSKNDENYEGWPFDQPFYLILNLAVGGNWGGKYGVDDAVWPQVMEVDYVKVYQVK